MNTRLDNAANDLWLHLTSGRLSLLFGAGVSFGAGIPLMYPLTRLIRETAKAESEDFSDLLDKITLQLPTTAHIEHILSQIGDLIALAQRSRNGSVHIGESAVKSEKLIALHSYILAKIAKIVRYGYKFGENGKPDLVGTPDAPIVTVEDHRAFVRSLFAARVRPGVLQAPVSFFTSNYDTLLEDALALERIAFQDGFLGGGMGFWAPESGYDESRTFISARIYKLHGSIDWHRSPEGAVIRCRDGCKYPEKTDNLLIYPQSTKYVATQRDPFASLFARFRKTLSAGGENVLCICGYSFGDEHVNGEIEAALAGPDSRVVVVAFAEERESQIVECGLSKTLIEWLSNEKWRRRIFVASNKGLYHGSVDNLYPPESSLDWWTFRGLTSYLAGGPEIVPANTAVGDEQELSDETI